MTNRLKAIRQEKKLLSNIFSLAVLQGANYILPLITLPYLVITLGVEKFGILAFAQAIITYFNILIDYGFNLSATRSIATHSENTNYISSIFSSVMLIKTFLLFCSFLILLILIYSFERIGNESTVYYLTFMMLIGNILFPIWYFQGIEEMKYITYINIFSKVLFTLGVFVFVHAPDDYFIVPMLNGLGFIIGGTIALTIALRSINFHIPSFEIIQKTFHDSTSLFISNASITLFTASNTFILGLFASNATVGIYSSIERLMMAVKNLYVPIYQGLFPWLSKKGTDEIHSFIKKFLPYIVGFSLISTLIIAIFAHPILSLIYHNDSINDHSYILQIFSLISVLSATNMLFNYLFLNAVKAYSERLKIFMIGGLFNATLGITLTYLYGITGMSITIVATETVLLLLGIRYYLQYPSSILAIKATK
jgi:PST family polysaccharide transporter